MATVHPRVQVTVDPELRDALAAIESASPKSRLIRDLALRGARAIEDERRGRDDGSRYLLKVARGEVDLDLHAARRLHEARGEHLP